MVVGALDGYNGTIFAYGQTGSGKTYTITGGAERYVDRGIIPRAISLVFSEVAERSEYTYTIHFSYLEVYNEMGYDLLNPDHETKALEDLPKVLLSFRYLEFNNIVIIFLTCFSIDNRVICKVTLSFGPPFTPYPLFQWYPQSKDVLHFIESQSEMLQLGTK